MAEEDEQQKTEETPSTDETTEIPQDETKEETSPEVTQAPEEKGESDEDSDSEPGQKKPEGEVEDMDEDLAEALGDEEQPTEEVDVDKAIAEEDPNFNKELGDISNEDFKGVVIDKNSASEEVDDTEKVPSAFKAFIDNLPEETKQRYYLATAIMLTLMPLSYFIYKGKVLPNFELPYVVSMNELTKDVYPYNVEGTWVPLFDESRTRSHTVQLPKAVINLRSRGGDSSYGEFKFSLVLRDEELSGAIDAKQSEILDLVQRVLEQITWDELQTPVGKEKVKKIIRHRINQYLQGNVVIGVYYQSVLLSK
jgi:hypothetical protein